MRKILLLLFVATMFFGSVEAQERKDDTSIKLIINGKIKGFRRFRGDTTIIFKKDKKWYIERNGEMLDTIDFSKEAKIKDVAKEVAKGNVQVVVDSLTKKVTYRVIRYKFSGHWSGFEFGSNTFVNSNGQIDLQASAPLMKLNTGKSWAFHWNFLQINAGIFKDKIGFVTGLGLNFNNYNFAKPITINSKDSAYTYFNYDSTANLKKNKLFVGYLTLPLLLEFQIHKKYRPGKPAFFFSTGVIGKLKIASRQKQVLSDSKVYINKNDFNLAPLNVDVTARFGNDTFTLFANYSLFTLFEEHKGPQIYPFTVGLGFVF